MLWSILCWSVCWSAVLLIKPTGKATHDVYILNGLHGLISTCAAVWCLWKHLDTEQNAAISISYFCIDLLQMVQADLAQSKTTLRTSRLMDYGHHLFGIGWGVALHLLRHSVCTPMILNPYIWIQTNEISTPFYNWFRWTHNKVAGGLFILTFFLSRVVMNTFYIFPLLREQCNVYAVIGCSPYFILQYVWFYMIIKRAMRPEVAKNIRD